MFIGLDSASIMAGVQGAVPIKAACGPRCSKCGMGTHDPRQGSIPWGAMVALQDQRWEASIKPLMW